MTSRVYPRAFHGFDLVAPQPVPETGLTRPDLLRSVLAMDADQLLDAVHQAFTAAGGEHMGWPDPHPDRVVADEDGVYTLVENRMESDDLTIRISVGRPRVVHELLVPLQAT